MSILLLEADLFLTHEKNIRQQCRNNKLKTIAQVWNDVFDLNDGFYSASDIQGYVKYNRKKAWITTHKSFLGLVGLTLIGLTKG